MFYGSTTLATSLGSILWQVRLLQALLFFIPKANPDYERLYPQIRKWLLELDDSGVPVREIALDVNGQPLFAAPDERNSGFWTDSTETFPQNQLSLITKEDFETFWSKVVK